jgi:hypothetical protein
MRFDSTLVVATLLCLLPVASSHSGIPADYKGKVFTGDTLKGHPQQIPGAIKAVFFDEGGEGVAYHDPRFIPFGSIRLDSLEKLVGMQPFGTGDQSIDGSAIPIGSYHLGWMDANEWIKCTVRIKTAGVYNISLFEAVASTPNSQAVSVNDGPPVMISNLPPTNGSTEIWHCWKTFNNVGTITLDTGLSVIKVDYSSATFNADKVIFTLKSPTVAAPEKARGLPLRAPSLTTRVLADGIMVSYSLSEVDNVALSIVDCKGRTVIALPERNLAAGNHDQSIAAGHLSDGVYIIRLKSGHGVVSTPLFYRR